MNTLAMTPAPDIQGNLRSALKNALNKAESEGSSVRAATLRLTLCAVRDRDIRAHQKDECKGCNEAEIVRIIRDMIDQRKLAIKEYEANGNLTLAEQEREELDVLMEFLPASLTPTELDRAAEQVVTDLEARCLKDLGRCVTELKARFPDRVESSNAKAAIRKLLN